MLTRRWVSRGGGEARFHRRFTVCFWAALSGNEGYQGERAKHRGGTFSMAKYPGAPPRPTLRRCPPHVPMKVVRTGGGCLVECLGCGKRGPARATSEAARAAFFEAG